MRRNYVRMVGLGVAGVYFLHAALTPQHWHFIDNVNLIFHEAGHVLFFFFGQWVQVAMGSGFQILLPLGIAGYFFYKKQRFESGITLMWAGESVANVSNYARDAAVMQLPLLGGDSVIHDWHYLLDTLHALAYAPQIADTLWSLGLTMVVCGVLLSLLYIKASAASTI